MKPNFGPNPKPNSNNVRYNYHMWVNQWTSHQYDLDAETFDGATEVSLTWHCPNLARLSTTNDPIRPQPTDLGIH